MVTLDALRSANAMLKKDSAHSSGPEFAARGFDGRVEEAGRLLSVRRGVERQAASASHAEGPAGAGEEKAKQGRYDKARLLDLKSGAAAGFGDSYVVTKRALLAEYTAGHSDKATLAALRGAEQAAVTGAAAAPPRLTPLKVFHDMMLGSADVYLVDKELEAALEVLRRGLAEFWGRRVAKHLSAVSYPPNPVPPPVSEWRDPSPSSRARDGLVSVFLIKHSA